MSVYCRHVHVAGGETGVTSSSEGRGRCDGHYGRKLCTLTAPDTPMNDSNALISKSKLASTVRAKLRATRQTGLKEGSPNCPAGGWPYG